MLQYIIFYVASHNFRCCSTYFFDVAVHVFSMLLYIFFDVAVHIFRCCSACFLMLHYIFFRCCSIYNPTLHYIVFSYVLQCCSWSVSCSFWDRSTVGDCVGEQRTGADPVLFRSMHGGWTGFHKGPVSGRTRALEVRVLESLLWIWSPVFFWTKRVFFSSKKSTL